MIGENLVPGVVTLTRMRHSINTHPASEHPTVLLTAYGFANECNQHVRHGDRVKARARPTD